MRFGVAVAKLAFVDLIRRVTAFMPLPLKDFLVVLAAVASVLGVIYIGMTLTLGQSWIDTNANLVFLHGVYWLLIPPAIWMVRYRPTIQAGFQSPKVKVILDNGMIVAEPCEWMAHRTAVSVFKFQDEVEQLVFSAYVVNIQSNKLVQLLPISAEGHGYDVSKLREIREKLLIKPGHLHE